MDFNRTVESVEEKTRTTNLAGGESFAPDTPEMQLYKLTLNNLLEDTYYESDTESLSKLIEAFNAVAGENPEFVMKLAAHAREDMGLREVSQVLMVLAANDERTRGTVRELAPYVLQRADEPAKCLGIQDFLNDPSDMSTPPPGSSPPSSLRKAISDYLCTIDEYEAGKYRQDNKEWSLVDVENVIHPVPAEGDSDSDRERRNREALRRLALGDLDDYPGVDPLRAPDTLQRERGGSTTTVEEWRQSLDDDMPLRSRLVNVVSMLESGLTGEEIFGDVTQEWVQNSGIWPFRYYQAAKAIQDARGASRNLHSLRRRSTSIVSRPGPMMERGTFENSNQLNDEYTMAFLSKAIDLSSGSLSDDLRGTHTTVDLSGSMDGMISEHSVMTRKEIGMLFGAMLAGKNSAVSGFGEYFEWIDIDPEVPVLDKMASIFEVDQEVGHNTNAYLAFEWATRNNVSFDRFFVFTDEQMWNSRSPGKSTHPRTSGPSKRSRARSTGRRQKTFNEALKEYRREVNPEATVYVIDLASYGGLSTPENAEGVFNISGWSDDVLDFIEFAENPGDQISAIESKYGGNDE